MPSIIVHNLSDAVYRALRVRAATHGRSAEAEIRDILAQTAKPPGRVRMGDALAEPGRRLELTNEDFEIFEQICDRKPAEGSRPRMDTSPPSRPPTDSPSPRETGARSKQPG